MLGGSSRISHHLRIRECNYHHYHQNQNLGLGFCSSRIFLLSSFMVRPLSAAIIGENRKQRLQQRLVSSSSLQSKSPGEMPTLPSCFSEREDDRELPAEGFSPVAGGIVALGKFDALHVGHRELAIQASKIGAPYLLSFIGMAEVFGWEPRAPIVAKCDRKRVLSSWAPYCGNVAPVEFQIQFSSVRHLSPQQFVEKLSRELGVRGVVAGENYRFGYKAAGDASELVRLCEEYGMDACIINSVMDKHQDSRDIDCNDSKERGQVSSTRVRQALAMGDMKYVSELLGRQHRLILTVNDHDELISTSNKHRVSVPKSCLLNLPPKEGFYGNSVLLFGEENPVKCRICIDASHIHLEMDKGSHFVCSCCLDLIAACSIHSWYLEPGLLICEFPFGVGIWVLSLGKFSQLNKTEKHEGGCVKKFQVIMAKSTQAELYLETSIIVLDTASFLKHPICYEGVGIFKRILGK